MNPVVEKYFSYLTSTIVLIQTGSCFFENAMLHPLIFETLGFCISSSYKFPPYNMLDWPHLVYAMRACSPNLVVDADCMEQIQQFPTRLVKTFRGTAI